MNAILVIDMHDAEAACFLPLNLNSCNRDISAHTLMVLQHKSIIHFINVIAGYDQHIFRIIALDIGHVLVNGISRSFVPYAALLLHVRRQYRHAAVAAVKSPRTSYSQVSIKLQRLVLRKNAHRIYAGMCAVA
ncbi:hypothetical protein D3C78_941790 [compost metagenome]